MNTTQDQTPVAAPTGSRERPILFSGEMVRSILEGRKTQTRRVVKDHGRAGGAVMQNGCGVLWYSCPYGQPGDRLWVRETWAPMPGGPVTPANGILYRSDGHEAKWLWRPSIFMPRWASRITLEIEAVRVERLKDISNEDCFAEGLPADSEKGNRTWYGDLWESINGKGSWDLNPWVWVIQFERVNAQGSGTPEVKP